jgi:GNAT superfamily N-acetyltransferase
VDPKFQGKGFAGRLIIPVLAKIDAQHLPCYLETFEEKNASIYECFGFRTIERASIPQTPFENWAMLRDAK